MIEVSDELAARLDRAIERRMASTHAA